MKAIRLEDFETTARRTLSAQAYDYFAGGADDEITLGENCEAWRRLRLYYRVLAGHEETRTTTTILGRPHASPLLLAPVAFQRMAHPGGELAVATAAREAGVTMILSTLASTSIEDVAATGVDFWFQLYVYRDRALTTELVRRAERAGAAALVLTVDAPLWGRRERDIRAAFQLPPGVEMANLRDSDAASFPHDADGSGLAAYAESLFDPSLSWADLQWLVELTDLPVVVKGLVRADDALRAADAGARAVFVSNHGGRQLDSAPATAEALAAVAAAAVGRDLEIYVDGGIRRGTDVVKALALGAGAVAIGRPYLWALAADGRRGVALCLALLAAEVERTLALAGAGSPSDVDASLVRVGGFAA